MTMEMRVYGRTGMRLSVLGFAAIRATRSAPSRERLPSA
jgi:hypothetical protein